jgi:hypothetical protein
MNRRFYACLLPLCIVGALTFIPPESSAQIARDLEIAERVPGYGGHFYARNMAVVVINLTDPQRQAPRAREVFETEWRLAGLREPPQRLEFRLVKYDMIDFARWDRLAREASAKRMTSIGSSVMLQQIIIGVRSEADVAPLLRELEALGIPRDVLWIEQSDGISW